MYVFLVRVASLRTTRCPRRSVIVEVISLPLNVMDGGCPLFWRLESGRKIGEEKSESLLSCCCCCCCYIRVNI